MRISICVCTRDRNRSLGRALTSLTRLTAEDLQWEVLVVDNGSAPPAARVAEAFVPKLNLRVAQ